MYNNRDRSFEELKRDVGVVRPFKVLKKGRGWVGGNIGWESDVTEGFDVDMVQRLVKEIEGNTQLNEQQKYSLEKEISQRINRYGDYRLINRGALNILLMVKNNVQGFTYRHKLASVQGLKKHALVYTYYVESKKTIVVEGISGVLGANAEQQIEEKIIYTAVTGLTEFGKVQINSLQRQGQRVVNRDLKNLRILGAI